MAKRNERGGGARKYDRNRRWCEAYRNRNQRAINQALRLARHLRRFPDDRAAARRLSELQTPGAPRAGAP